MQYAQLAYSHSAKKEKAEDEGGTKRYNFGEGLHTEVKRDIQAASFTEVKTKFINPYKPGTWTNHFKGCTPNGSMTFDGVEKCQTRNYMNNSDGTKVVLRIVAGPRAGASADPGPPYHLLLSNNSDPYTPPEEEDEEDDTAAKAAAPAPAEKNKAKQAKAKEPIEPPSVKKGTKRPGGAASSSKDAPPAATGRPKRNK